MDPLKQNNDDLPPHAYDPVDPADPDGPDQEVEDPDLNNVAGAGVVPILKNAALWGTGGTIAGGVVVLCAFAVIGLSPMGPVAGGIFASNMGAGLVALSPMSLLQSAAMTAGAYYTGAAVGGVTGAAIGANRAVNADAGKYD